MLDDESHSVAAENVDSRDFLELAGVIVSESPLSRLSWGTAFSKKERRMYPLGAHTILYGPNGSGKTSFLNLVRDAFLLEGNALEGLVYRIRKKELKLLKLSSALLPALFADGTVEFDEDYKVQTGNRHFLFEASQRKDLGTYSFKELEGYWGEWLQEGLVLATKSLNAEDSFTLVPIVRYSHDDNPKTTSAFDYLRSQIKLANPEATGYKTMPIVEKGLGPVLNGRNFPRCTSQAGLWFLDIDKDPATTIVYLDPLPVTQIIEATQPLDRDVSREISDDQLFVEGLKNLWCRTMISFVLATERHNQENLFTHSTDEGKTSVMSGRDKLRDLFFQVIKSNHSEGDHPTPLEEVADITETLLGPLVQEIFPDWEKTTIDWGTEEGRIRGSSPDWNINDKFGLSGASAAQIRWLNILTDVISATHNREVSLFLVDEPELGLHRQAEWVAAAILKRLRSMMGYSVVTTHSPAFFDMNGSTLLRVDRGEVRDLTLRAGELETIGLQPADLLGLYRAFLIVEGEHDKLVLNHFLGETFDKLRIKLVQASGGKTYPGVVASGLLFDYSSAPIIVTSDALENEKLNEVWSEMKAVFEKDPAFEIGRRVSRATRVFKSAFALGGSNRLSGELSYILETMKQVLFLEQHRRVQFFGFSKKDIQFYLDASSFGFQKSWEELSTEHEAARSGKPFKSYFVDNSGKPLIHSDSIKAALEKFQDSVPQDFADLDAFLKQL
jgi:energy-coupling factor transporter ATP-binding protein EcfA2